MAVFCRVLVFCFICFARPAVACLPEVAALDTPLSRWQGKLTAKAPRFLAELDPYLAAAEACYGAPLGQTALTAATRRADAYADKVLAFRRQAQAAVRGDEFAYEKLLASPLWRNIETLRVASAYAQAWAHLAQSAAEISADARAKGVARARQLMQGLTLEFLHPLLVQRAMYGLAVAHIENGDVARAQASLQRVQKTLDPQEQAEMLKLVSDYLAEISAPDFRPPMRTAAAPSPPTAPADPKKLRRARALVRQGAPPIRVVEILQPLIAARDATARAALAMIFADPQLMAVATAAPMRSVQNMEKAFAATQYGGVIAAFKKLRDWLEWLPPAARAHAHYQVGAAHLARGAAGQAEVHLQAAMQATPAQGAARTQVTRLWHLAMLSRDADPTAETLTLARRTAAAPFTGDDRIGNLLALRARIALARDAAARADWAGAAAQLVGVDANMVGYRQVLGMRVRLAARQARAAPNPKNARRVAALYRLWRDTPCPMPCVRAATRPVHRAFLLTAAKADLPPADFGRAWSAFEAVGGDIAPLIAPTLAYLTRQKDTARLLALLETPSDAARHIRAHWARYLRELAPAAPEYDFLATLAAPLQGEVKGDLLEALTQYALPHSPMQALVHADMLAQYFPRRPAAWLLRARALSANARHVEAARALTRLIRRTPPDEPIGLAARIGLAAVFADMGRGDAACQIHAKLVARPHAAAHFQKVQEKFAYAAPWRARLRAQCRAS